MSDLFDKAKAKLDTLLGSAYDSDPNAWKYENEDGCLLYHHISSKQYVSVKYTDINDDFWVHAKLLLEHCSDLNVDFEHKKMTVRDTTSTRIIHLHEMSGKYDDLRGVIFTDGPHDEYHIELILTNICHAILRDTWW